MQDNRSKADPFEELFKIKGPPGLDFSFRTTEPEILVRIEETQDKIKKSVIFHQGNLKVGEEGKGEAIPIPSFDQFCLELAVEIILNLDRQDQEIERRRIEKEYSDLEGTFHKFIFNLFYRQGHLPSMTTLRNRKMKIKKIIELWEGITELKEWAIGQLSDSPMGKAKPDLRDQLAKIFTKHIPGVTPSNIDTRLNDLSSELDLRFPSGPDAIRKRIERQAK